MSTTPRARLSPIVLAFLLVAGAMPVLPVADAAAPVVASAHLLDEDNNGHLDAVLLTFDQSIRPESVRPSDWTLGTQVARSVERVVGSSNTQYKLFFQEGLALDGAGNAVNVAYVRDADQPLENAASPHEDYTVTSVPTAAKLDKAKPVLMAAYAAEATNYIVAVFSEAVTDNAGSPITHDEFVLTPGGSGAPAIDTVAAVTALGSPARVFRIPLTTAWTAAQLADATKPVLAISGTNLVKDAANNNNPAGMAGVPIGAPFIERVMGNPGDDVLVVEFNGPVADVTGTAPLAATSSGDLVLRFQEGSSGGAIVTTDLVNPSFSDRVQIRVDAPLRLADFCSNPPLCTLPSTVSRIVAQADKVYAWKGSSAVTNYKVPAGASAALLDSTVYTNPYPTRLETVDRDLNGCIDAIQITWSDDMDDSTTVGSDGWAVVFPQKASGSPLPTTPPPVRILTSGAGGVAMVTTLVGPGVSSALSPGTNDRVTFLTFSETAVVAPDTATAASGCNLTLPKPIVGSTGAAGVRLLPRVSRCDGLDVPSCTPGAVRDRSGRAMGTSRGAFDDTGRLFRLPVLDSARPVLMMAATRDLPSAPDGLIDQMVLTFSEPMKVSTLKQAQWNVRVPAGQAACTVAGNSGYVVTSVGSASTPATDAEPVLLLGLQPSGNPEGDTGCILDVSYTNSPNALESTSGQTLPTVPANGLTLGSFTATAAGTSRTFLAGGFAGAFPGMRVDISRAGSPLGSFTVTGVSGGTLSFSPDLPASGTTATGDVATVYRERDGAGPVLMDGKLVGAVGSRFATATFSEPVFGANGGVPTNTDLSYKNNGAGGASGISCVRAKAAFTSGSCGATDPPEPTGMAQLSLMLNNVLASGDVGSGKDCIQAVNYIPDENAFNPANPGIRDAAGNVGQPLESTSGPCRIFATGGTISGVVAIETLDTESPPDGSIDTIRVTFSQPLNDNFSEGVGKWTVKFGATTATITGVHTGDLSCGGAPLTPNVANDAVIFLCVTELTDPIDGSRLPNTGALPLVSYSGTALAGASDGLPVATFTDRAATDAALPVLVSVRGGAGLEEVELRFSEDVVDSTTKGPLKASNFLYSNGNGGSSTCFSGASNIIQVDQIPGVNDRFRGKLNTPAGQAGLHYDDIVGCPTGGRDEVRALASSIIEKVGLKAMTDSTPRTIADVHGPTILSARFVDAPALAGGTAGADGIVDAVEIRFREYVSDSAVGAFGTAAAVTGQWAVKVNDGTLRNLRVKEVVSHQGGTSGTCTDSQGRILVLWPGEAQPPTTGSTVDGAHDDTIFLCLDNAAGVAAQGTLGLGTGMIGTLSYAAASPAARIKDRSANGFADIAVGSARPIVDGARPVVLNTCRPEVTLAPRCTGVSPETADLDNDGHVDALRVTLSEGVRDSTYKQVEWDLGSGFAITGMESGTVDDAVIYLQFAERATPDTGRGRAGYEGLPDLTFSSTGTMADRNGNRIRPVLSGMCGAATDTNCADERDGVEPVVVRAQAEVGSDLVTVALSEGVQGTGPAASNRRITSADIAYDNRAGAGDGATGIEDISHTGGESVFIVKLNSKVTEFDRANDRFVFVTGSIKESQCSVSSTTPSCYRQLAMTRLSVPIAFAGGADPKPSTIEDLEAPPEDITATSVKLTWTAPDDTDLVSYQIYYCTCTFSGNTVPGSARVPPPSVTIPTPDPGEEQEVVIPGLTTGETYQFVIRAIDRNGNTGDLSLPVEVVVEAPDTTAPDAVTPSHVPATPGDGAGTARVRWTAPGDDGDSGGPVDDYRVAVAPRPITTEAEFDLFEATGDVIFSPASLAAPGARQEAILGGLSAGDEVFVYVRALDDAGNESPLGGSARVTIGETSDPAAPGAISDLTATGATDTTVDLEWRAPGDDGLTGNPVNRFEVFYSTSPITEANRGEADRVPQVTLSPVSPPAAGSVQRATVRGLESDTTYYFMVVSRDDAGKTNVSNVVSRATEPAEGELTLDDLFEANRQINDSLTVSHEDGTNIVEFEIPDSALAMAKGIQVWRSQTCEDGDYVLVNTYDVDHAFFDERRFEEEGDPTDCYKVTMFTKSSQESALGPKEDADDIERFGDLESASASAAGGLNATWLLIGGAALLALLLAALLVFLVRRRGRGGQALAPPETVEGEGGEAAAAEGWSEVPQEGAAEAAPAAEAEAEPVAEAEQPVVAPPEAAPAAAAAATTHYVTCPKCSTPFSAVGVKPLAIQCPSCGVRGTLR